MVNIRFTFKNSTAACDCVTTLTFTTAPLVQAKLMRDDYCDGLSDCLPACPTGAITFVERDATAYDEEAGWCCESSYRIPACPQNSRRPTCSGDF